MAGRPAGAARRKARIARCKPLHAATVNPHARAYLRQIAGSIEPRSYVRCASNGIRYGVYNVRESSMYPRASPPPRIEALTLRQVFRSSDFPIIIITHLRERFSFQNSPVIFIKFSCSSWLIVALILLRQYLFQATIGQRRKHSSPSIISFVNIVSI